MNTMQYDVVIVGAGVAGLYTAMQFDKETKVLVINKATPWECNTFYAQGGISVAYDEADKPVYFNDTFEAGAKTGDKEAINVLVEHSIDVVSDLIDKGFAFDTNEQGELLYTKEAAHSRARILHAGGDATGRYLHQFLLKQLIHPMLEQAVVIDLLFEESDCVGLVIEHNGEQRQIFAKHIVIASGGVGSLYSLHTNAYTISADLHGICLEHGIALRDMHLLQFHPTVFVDSKGVQKLLLTEALRGEGAKIEDEARYRFLEEYDTRCELAPRDIVSRAIFDYASKHNKSVYLNFETFSKEYFVSRFPNISKKLIDAGYNVPHDRVPISPAFHYAVGGILTDLNGKVDAKNGLFAVGEVASTGVHGANRLASNSLLEGLVFAKRVAQQIKRESRQMSKNVSIPSYGPLFLPSDTTKKSKLRELMWQYVSIVRSKDGLKVAQKEIAAMLDEEVGRLLRLRLICAKEIVSHALKHTTSVGVHFMKES